MAQITPKRESGSGRPAFAQKGGAGSSAPAGGIAPLTRSPAKGAPRPSVPSSYPAYNGSYPTVPKQAPTRKGGALS